MEKSYLNKRKRIFISKKFQIKYTGLILLSVFLSAVIVGYTIYYNSWMLLGEKLANVYPQGRLVQIFKIVNIRIAVSMVFLSLFCVIIGIMASHKIAGPVYRMIQFLDNLSGGDYRQRLKLRKGDELQDLADAINRLIDKLEGEKKP